ncbi:MAG: deoxynucleoside kinase [candidate division Zixibacteria bacterium]|nr:deoxynucleoside kinase [candidate division Zixibacteria bacterium]NIR68091.1 deoxynucleoside kinase [candidate division Zixibacteria bacterium]NIS17639.1 deoxynucleoside kinase [candidate division Zixibacteria bacterium]NIS48271.1 deoxynucleoside kinase [candidate division Zixibacteria bacterium]NIT53948.1 deoxynucleoside kinase [candidate division Zixibacteria bacterium]
MKSVNYIAVEGPIGVGKTSLAKRLAERMDAHLIMEEATENPFLADFYRNKKKYAFQTQIFFLLARYQQLAKLNTLDLFHSMIISDYTFEKDQLFAKVNLEERELILYDKIAASLSKDVPKPDLVIFLQAATETLYQRIKQRGVPFERNIDIYYLDELNEAYNYYFFEYDQTPLLVVKTDEIDFVNNADDFNDLVEQIQKPLSGTHYYVPPGSLEL